VIARDRSSARRRNAHLALAVLACALAGAALWWWRQDLGLGVWPAALVWLLLVSKVVAVSLALRAQRD